MLFVLSEAGMFLQQFSRRKLKAIGVFGFVVLAYLVGVSDPKHNLDYGSYHSWFRALPGMAPANYPFEKGYAYLSVWASKNGLSYATFRLLLCAVATLLLYIGVRRFTKNTALFAGIYGATVFFVDATQVRNYLMLTIALLAMSFLQQVDLKHVLIASILIVISAQFHSLGYIFFLAILLRLVPFDRLYRLSLPIAGIIIVAILGINIVGVRRIIKLVASLAGVFGDRANLVQKVSQQYGDGSVLIRYVAVAVVSLAAFLLVWFLYRLVAISGDRALIAKYQIIFSTVLVSVILLPTLSLADDYSRIPRCIFLFVILAVCLYYENTDEIQLTRMRSLVTFLIVLVCFMNGFAHFYTWGTAYRASVIYLTGIL